MKKLHFSNNILKKERINLILVSALAVLILILIAITLQSKFNITQQSISSQENPPKNSHFIREVEQSIHYHTNLARKNNNLQPLEFDNRLATIARAHSKDMADNNYLAHQDRQGRDATTRAKEAGYNITKLFPEGRQSNYIQENAGIAYIYKSKSEQNGTTIYNWKTPDEIGKEMVDALMSSTSHRNHILEKDATKEGIGAAINNESLLYFTQMFW